MVPAYASLTSLSPMYILFLLSLFLVSFISWGTKETSELMNSLVIQWLGLCDSTSGCTGSIPGWGTKILHAVEHGQKKKNQTLKKKKKKNLGPRH